MGCGASQDEVRIIHAQGAYPQQQPINNNVPRQPQPMTHVPQQQQQHVPPPQMQQQHPPQMQQQHLPIVEEPVKQNSTGEENTPITMEVLNEFVSLETEIQELEKNGVHEKLVLHHVELKNLTLALEKQEMEFEEMKKTTLKEYQDFSEFDVATLMAKNNMSVVSKEEINDAKHKEELEYMEAKNKQEICEKQLQSLQHQLLQISGLVEDCKKDAERLKQLNRKEDGILENIFNGAYGSELEEKFELESDQLLQKKQYISVAHFKWWNGRQLVVQACSQMSYACRRWAQIQEVTAVVMSNNVKYHMVTEVRNNMIAAHQNRRRAAEYMQSKLPYWTVDEDKNMISAINLIYNDVTTYQSYNRALAWFKFFHWRLALQLNWMDQVINNKIVADHKRVAREFKSKYHELRVERLKCIKEKIKEVLNVDLDIDQFSQPRQDGVDDEELQTVESNMAIAAESYIKSDQGSICELPAANVADSDQTLIENVVKENESSIEIEENSSSDGPPSIKIIPLAELAPTPSDGELFGDVEELQKLHQKQLEEFQQAQDSNQARQQQGFEEKLRMRRSKRKREKLQEEQETALK